MIAKAFESVLSDEAFNLPTAPAESARRAATQVLENNRRQVEEFGDLLVHTLKSCFTISQSTKIRTRIEKMWEQYYQLRSSEEFAKKWVSFLEMCGAEPTNILYQHITDYVFNHLIKSTYPITTGTQREAAPPELDYHERNALRYVRGYTTRHLYAQLKRSANVMKEELMLCLSELNDVDPTEMEDDSNDWMVAVDRGGLQHTSEMMYMVFMSAEEELRKHLPEHGTATTLNVTQFKPLLTQNDDVQFYWSIVSSNWTDTVSSTLLDLLLDQWITIRGHSTATAWLEQYKRKKKKTVQKSKGVRKNLVSESTSTRAPANAEP